MNRLEGPECSECDHTEGQHDTGAYEVGHAHYGPCEVSGCDCQMFNGDPDADDGDGDARDAGHLRRYGWFPTDDCLPDGAWA